jgi:hypothetical protein
MTREEVIAQLHEPHATLSEEVRNAASKMAASDPEITELWKLNQSLAQLSASRLFGESELSNAQFITSLRAKMDARKAQPRTGYLGSWKLISTVASICVVLVVFIFTSGSSDLPYDYQLQDPVAISQTSNDQIADISNTEVEQINPDTLAAYLDVPTDYLDSESDVDDDDTGTPYMDDLMALDQSDLDVVLNNLEQTNFF